MKLRLVKFLTSHENEIEKKEEGGGSTTIMRSASTQPGRGLGQSPAPFSLSSSLHLSILSFPAHQPASFAAPACQPPRVAPAIPPPAVPLLPSFFIKLPKQQSGRPLRSVVPSLPAQLADCGRPACPQARSLPVPSLSSTVSAFSRLQVRPVRSGWSHRKTKTENEVPCFVFFIDE